ncbi:MAG: TetR/AcrR family transcriptional regulator C-terminal domain-containing protein [Kineosporiaceae bacterium]
MPTPASPPVSRRIADDLAARIDGGELLPGDALPSARALCRQHGIALATATKVLADLRTRGLTDVRPGIGTVVAARRTATPSRRGAAAAPTGEVSTADVVATAVRIADTEGMGALTIRRIATELGLPTMSVYRFVPSKDMLVLLMSDEVFGRMPLPPRPRGWREAMELAARRQWELHRRHPWVAATMSFTRPVMAPRAMAWTEWLMSALDAEGVGPADQLQLAVVVAGYVHGMGVKLESELEQQQHTGLTSEEWMRRHEAEFAAAAGASGLRFPLLTRAASPEHEPDMDLDALFELGLRLLLDGLDAELARLRRR